jgi:hypothetical protein
VLDVAEAVLEAIVVDPDEVALVVWLAFVVAVVAAVAAAAAFTVVFVDVDGESTKAAMPLILVSTMYQELLNQEEFRVMSRRIRTHCLGRVHFRFQSIGFRSSFRR